MKHRITPYCAMAATAAVALAGAATAKAATTDGQARTSSNWAGYEVAANSPDQRFTNVRGSWTEPDADCSQGDGSAAFWVGLGGGDEGASGLEQVGTEIDCSDGQARSHAWYELIPAAPVDLDLSITPGDHISGSVSVDGNDVTVSLKDDTTGKSVTKQLSTQNIDVSTAEWVAEAPSACDSSGGCQPVTLADFGSVSFTGAAATADGHTGSIADAQWSGAPLQLAAADGASGGAAPSSLSSDGGAFSVAWQQGAAEPTQDNQGGAYGYGDGGSYGYGDGGYGDGGGYGYGYGGGYGYGDPPYGYGEDPGFAF